MSYQKVVPIILAGKRQDDPLSEHFQVENKAFIELKGKCLIDWVLNSIEGTQLSEPYLSISEFQKELFEKKIQNHSYKFILNNSNESPVLSCIKALDLIDEEKSLFITTADNPLLTPQIIKYFLDNCEKENADLIIGVVNGQDRFNTNQVDNFSKLKRTWHKVNKSLWLSGANLFYWSKKSLPNSLKQILIKLETQRKSPLAFSSTVAKIDFIFLLKYFFQLSSLKECERALSKTIGIQVKLLILPFPEACIDVDKISDYELAKTLLRAD
ncbi:MAG: nucleotidyltransferase family protein [Candidatus Caenarcaniphilales bacterium]|nr:nucleotidyltransferase family protein [Candidatus Caenarcaniphilales bacterium]